MAYQRPAIITEVRDSFYEDTADLFTDAKLQRFLNQELRSLPSKDIYSEEIWKTSTVVDQIDYTLPSSTKKIEKVERDYGTSTQHNWVEVKGWDNYGGAIYLDERPTTVWTMRLHLKKAFADLNDDTTYIDVPDEKMEIVVWGTVVRAYRAFIGYLRMSKNWDAVGSPNAISMSAIMNWYQMAKKEYNDLVNIYKTIPRPRDINLVD